MDHRHNNLSRIYTRTHAIPDIVMSNSLTLAIAFTITFYPRLKIRDRKKRDETIGILRTYYVSLLL